METKRTHDKLYLNEDYKRKPKEYFKELAKIIENDFGGKLEDKRLIDIGCETGSFLHYVESLKWNCELYGIDIMPELLQALDKDNSIHATTYLANIADENTLPNIEADIVTLLGVMSIFDDFKPIISNIIKLLNPDGTAYIFGIFNPENLDVIVKSKSSGSDDENWESGWNLFSIKSVELFCEEKGLSCEFIPFKIGIDIAKHDDDPLRSWTLDMPNNDRMIVNGLQIIHHFYFLKIKHK